MSVDHISNVPDFFRNFPDGNVFIWKKELKLVLQLDRSKYMYGKKQVLSIYVMYHFINPLSDDKILDWSKLKQIADDILKFI